MKKCKFYNPDTDEVLMVGNFYKNQINKIMKMLVHVYNQPVGVEFL